MPTLASLLLVSIMTAYGSFAWQTLSHARPLEAPAPALAFLRPLSNPLEAASEFEINSPETIPSPVEITAESPYIKPDSLVPSTFAEFKLPELPLEPCPKRSNSKSWSIKS